LVVAAWRTSCSASRSGMSWLNDAGRNARSRDRHTTPVSLLRPCIMPDSVNVLQYNRREICGRKVEPAQAKALCAFVRVTIAGLCIAYTMKSAMLEWDGSNLRKIRAHRMRREEAGQALLNDPIPVYEQDVEGEYASCTTAKPTRERLVALVVTERAGNIRVVTAYDLDAGQKREYLERRSRGE